MTDLRLIAVVCARSAPQVLHPDGESACAAYTELPAPKARTTRRLARGITFNPDEPKQPSAAVIELLRTRGLEF